MLLRSVALALLLASPVTAEAAGYLVRSGDTLGSVAARHGVSVRVLARVNGIANINLIRLGQYLTIPSRPRVTHYRVRWGDTLLGIAAHYHVTVRGIRSSNPHLGSYPLAGQWLTICRSCGGHGTPWKSPPTTAVAWVSSGVPASYVVQVGDTLSGIAAHFGLSSALLMRANGLVNPNIVVLGRRLRIPGPFLRHAQPSYPVVPYDPWTARVLITHWAHRYGLDPALPLAIGWQESGFNENEISRTGAIGVMQVEPYTGDRISALLGRRMNLHDLHDNIQAGVFWISQLVQYYGGNERLAIAAYYQGSRSLAHHGFYDDTVQYVTDVTALRAGFSA